MSKFTAITLVGLAIAALLFAFVFDPMLSSWQRSSFVSPYDELYEEMVTTQAELAETYWDPESSDTLRQDARVRFGALIMTCMEVAARVDRDYEPCFKPIFHEGWEPSE